MLRRCVRKLSRGLRPYSLFHGEAEHLPFRDGLFDCVYHIGGINFFNDKAQAIREMIRVAKPGAKIVLSDETEEVVRENYQRNPATRAYFEKGTEAVSAPIDLVPAAMQKLQLHDICKGKLYCLSFCKPSEG
jgi:ubiquinone/menaquinone biosynthesis C-methylase UbiE